MSRLSDADLLEIEQRANAATDPPWMQEDIDEWVGAEEIPDESNIWADRRFMVHAREDVPKLIQEIRRLRALLPPGS